MIKGIIHAALVVEDHGDEELADFRLAKCYGCSEFKNETIQCGVCGCYMDIKTKSATYREIKAGGQVRLTHCPLGRWGDKVIANIYRAIDGKELLN